MLSPRNGMKIGMDEIQFWNILAIYYHVGLQHFDGDFINFYVIWDTKFPVEYLYMPSQRWTSQENFKIFHFD